MPKEDVNEEGRAGAWGRLRLGLRRTRGRFAAGLGNLLLGERALDQAALEDLETALLTTDVGAAASGRIIDALTGKVRRQELNDKAALRNALAELLKELVQPLEQPFRVGAQRPCVVLAVGVNGAGKTTSLGKLARLLQQQDQRVLLAAGDTFRAAAVEQLRAWGARNDVSVVAQQQGSDSASVIYDAIESARSRNCDVVLCDTAGRLQAREDLMQELRKVRRVIQRLDPTAPHETLLVLDAGVGQNALRQLASFDAAVGVTGIILAKLDGSARAGVVCALAEQMRAEGAVKPVYFVGVGEHQDALGPFSADAFVDALLAPE